jgi:AcrR family transcriptional regulator
LAVAERILATKGCQQFSTMELATELGVGKGTVYSHYPSQDSLLKAVLGRVAEQLLLDIQVDPSASAPERLTLTVSKIVECIANSPEGRLGCPCCLKLSPCPYGECHQVWDRLHGLIAESARQGAIRQDVDAALAARCLQHLLSAAAKHPYQGKERMRNVLWVTHLYLHGVLGPAGQPSKPRGAATRRR